jgi:hypothetical protein
MPLWGLRGQRAPASAEGTELLAAQPKLQVSEPREPPAAPPSTSAAASSPAARATGSRYSRAEPADFLPVKVGALPTAANIMNGVLGTAIVGLPYAFMRSGLPMGIVSCVLIAVLSSATLRLLVDLGRAHGASTYEDLTCVRRLSA